MFTKLMTLEAIDRQLKGNQGIHKSNNLNLKNNLQNGFKCSSFFTSLMAPKVNNRQLIALSSS